VVFKLDVKLRTPIPDMGVDELPIPCMSKTPNNPIEAALQSDFNEVGTTTSTPLWDQVEWMCDF
jgi:hypothetical protein